MKLSCIVEGHGDVHALPLLVRRIAAEVAPGIHLEIARPIRQPRNKVVKEGELERAIGLARARTEPGDAILVLLDADRDCAAEHAPALLQRAQAVAPDHRVAVVFACVEFESWFLAGVRSLAGKKSLPHDLEPPEEPEAVRDAKKWLTRRMPPGTAYKETVDQPAFAALISLDEARSAPSFRKLERDLRRLLRAE